MTGIALGLVLTSALMHASWNFFAKRADGGLPFAWMFSALGTLVFLPVIIIILIVEQPLIGLREWVDTTPVSSGMDQARLSLADVLASSDINASLALANQLSTTRGRDDAIARYYRAWRKTDDQSAQEWLTTNWSTFSASTQQRLTVEQYRPIVAR